VVRKLLQRKDDVVVLSVRHLADVAVRVGEELLRLVHVKRDMPYVEAAAPVAAVVLCTWTVLGGAGRALPPGPGLDV